MLNRILGYFRRRLGEGSTWRGLILLATAYGANLSPEQMEAIMAFGLSAAGALGVLWPEKR